MFWGRQPAVGGGQSRAELQGEVSELRAEVVAMRQDLQAVLAKL